MDEKEVPSDEDVARDKEVQKENSAFTIKWFVFLVLAAAAMVYISRPAIKKSAKMMEMTQAVTNSKQIYLVLMDFESDMGYFPDDASAAKKPVLNSFHGDYSNDYLGQLIAGGYTKSEEIFFAYDKRFKNEKPDDVISPPSRILEQHECGFAYVMVEEKEKRRGLSTSDTGSLPILLTPLLNEWGSMDMESHKGRGVHLRVDGSARSDRLDPVDHKIHLKEGSTLLDSGPSTMWGDMKPVVLLPDR
jgi:hypothetical protein